MIDTHCHLNFKVFENDWREVVERAIKNGVEKMIVVGTDLESSRRAVEMAQKHEALYAGVGVHPHHARAMWREDSNNYQELQSQIEKQIEVVRLLAREPKVVAIGEVGLDKHRYQNSKYQMLNEELEDELFELQKQLFVEQVKLAGEVDKPLIIHSREVGDEVLSIIQNDELKMLNVRGVFHCFEGSKKYVRRILEAGFYVSFTGNVTYEQGRLGVAGEVPQERLLLETDSPLITPEPLRGQRNEPTNVRLIAEVHSLARGVGLEEIERITNENAQVLFNFSLTSLL